MENPRDVSETMKLHRLETLHLKVTVWFMLRAVVISLLTKTFQIW